MNCKPGDLARVISGSEEGAICKVIRPAFIESMFFGTFAWQVELLSVARVMQLSSRQTKTCLPGTIVGARDAVLRPIPPEELQDELAEETADATPA